MESAKRFPVRQSRKAASAISRAERCAMSSSVRSHARSSNRVIMESEFPHRFTIQQISSTEDDRRLHLFIQVRQVHVRKLMPVRGDDQRFGASDGFQSRRGKFRV